MLQFKKFLLPLVALVIGFEGLAQTASSPFSTFGVGERFSNALINNQGMGGVAVSQPQYWYPNNVNPALLVYNTLTVFNAGMIYEQRRISGETLSEKTQGGNLSNLVLAFPVIRTKWSTSLSLSPYSSVKYNLASTRQAGGGSDAPMFETYENGSGGLTQLSWSHGVGITRGVSVGLKANYVFGSIVTVHQDRMIDDPQPLAYFATTEERSYAKDFTFSAGVSFTKDSLFARSRYRLSFGAVYDFATDLKAKTRTLQYRTNQQGTKGNKLDLDTLGGTRGGFTLPAGLTTGLSLSTNKWGVGAGFSYYDWTSFESLNDDDEFGLSESWRVAIGGEITPDSYSGKYLNRVTYRLGATYEQLPYNTGGNPVKDLGMTVGFSLPAGSSSMDVGVKYGKRGARSENGVGENYFKVFFGITVNDRWFIRRKFD